MDAVSCFVVQSTSPVHWSSPVIVDRHCWQYKSTHYDVENMLTSPAKLLLCNKVDNIFHVPS